MFGLFLAVVSMALVQVGCDPKAMPASSSAPTAPATVPYTTTLATGLSGAYGVVADKSGNAYVSEYSTGNIIKVTPGGVTSTFASGFSHVRSLAIDGSGNIYVADCYHHAIKKVSPAGVVTTLVQDPFSYFRPRGVAVDNGGTLYATGGYRFPSVWKIANGVFTTLASGFNTAGRMAVDPNNSSLVYASDNGNHAVNKIVNGVVTPIATNVGKTRGITVDNKGNVIFCSSNGNVYRVTPAGVQTTLTTVSNPGGIYISPANQGRIYVLQSTNLQVITLPVWP